MRIGLDEFRSELDEIPAASKRQQQIEVLLLDGTTHVKQREALMCLESITVDDPVRVVRPQCECLPSHVGGAICAPDGGKLYASASPSP